MLPDNVIDIARARIRLALEGRLDPFAQHISELYSGLAERNMLRSGQLPRDTHAAIRNEFSTRMSLSWKAMSDVLSASPELWEQAVLTDLKELIAFAASLAVTDLKRYFDSASSHGARLLATMDSLVAPGLAQVTSDIDLAMLRHTPPAINPSGQQAVPSAHVAADRHFMLLAIELARKSQNEPGRVSPKVGAVLVLGGKVIGEAYRGELAPGNHAEFTLLEMKLRDTPVAGATLYTTLEPCTSRNPPKVACADRIIERRIKRVVIGTIDPNDRIRGLGELRLRSAGIDVARFDPDLMALIEELNRDFTRQHAIGARDQRTTAQTTDPVADRDLGPNGHRIGYTADGDKVEWVPDDEAPGEEMAILLRRNDNAILEAYRRFWDMVWWNRHQIWLEQLSTGDNPLTEDQKSVLEQAKKAAKKIEDRYGRENLGWDDFEFGLISGRLSALSWVMGAEWDASLDT